VCYGLSMRATMVVSNDGGIVQVQDGEGDSGMM
jgi:hypothetical protein